MSDPQEINYIPCPIEGCKVESWISHIDPQVSISTLFNHIRVDHADFDEVVAAEIMSKAKPVMKGEKNGEPTGSDS